MRFRALLVAICFTLTPVCAIAKSDNSGGLAASNDEITQLQGMVADLQTQVAALTQRVTSQSAQINSLQADINDLLSALSTLSQSQSDLSQSFDAQKADVDARIADLQAQIDQLKPSSSTHVSLPNGSGFDLDSGKVVAYDDPTADFYYDQVSIYVAPAGKSSMWTDAPPLMTYDALDYATALKLIQGLPVAGGFKFSVVPIFLVQTDTGIYKIGNLAAVKTCGSTCTKDQQPNLTFDYIKLGPVGNPQPLLPGPGGAY